MKYSLITAFLLLFLSCGITKNKTSKNLKTDTEKLTTEIGEIYSTRKGDTLTYTVLNPILKDTIITVKNTEKTYSNTLRILHDENGISEIKCISAEIAQLKKYIQKIEENKTEELAEKSKFKETFYKPIMLLYIFLGLAFLILVVRILKKIGI